MRPIDADKLKRNVKNHCAMPIWCHELVKAEIDEQPTIEYGTWIPVTERLPEEPEENPEFDGKPLELYLVSVNDEEYPFRAFWNGKCFTDGAFKVNAVAWMPLPEPYREEKDDRD